MAITEAAKTHILFSYNTRHGINVERIYFNGRVIETEEPSEVDIEWEWTTDKQQATAFHCPDAWNLLGIARQFFEGTQIDIERI